MAADTSIADAESAIAGFRKISAYNQQLIDEQKAKQAALDTEIKNHDWEIIKKTGTLSNVSGNAANAVNLSALIKNAVGEIRSKGLVEYLNESFGGN